MFARLVENIYACEAGWNVDACEAGWKHVAADDVPVVSIVRRRNGDWA